MNYKYQFAGENVILTEQEHKTVVNNLAIGKHNLVLRNGKLIINAAMVGVGKETNEPASEREELMRLASPKYSDEDTPESKQRRSEQIKKMGKEMFNRPLKIAIASPLITYTDKDSRKELQRRFERGEVNIYGEEIAKEITINDF